MAYPFGRTSPAWEAAGAARFEQISPLLAQGDLAVANLEGPWTRRQLADPANRVLVTPPERLAWLVAAGFNLFSVANNHSLDAGLPGMSDTLREIHALSTSDRPLWVAGAGADSAAAEAPAEIVIAGKRTRLALFAFAPAAFTLVDYGRSPTALARIRTAASAGRTVIVSVHDGDEFRHVPGAELCARYRSYVDAGARVVLGHHPHVAQGIERHGAGVIFYSLGNLSFGVLANRERTGGAFEYGLLARVTLRDGQLDDVRAFPLFIGNMEPLRDAGVSVAPQFTRPQRLLGPLGEAACRRIVGWSNAVPGADKTDLSCVDDAIVVALK